MKNELKNRFNISSYLFIRLLAIVYLIAFSSFWSQAFGLIGSDGILPVKELIPQSDFLLHPSVFFISTGDWFIHLVCFFGVLFSVLVFLGFIQGPLLLFLWFLYLSVANGSQIFLGYQWDYLLLETGFLTLFIAPWNLFGLLRGDTRAHLADFSPSRFFIFLFHLLLFKLMFSSGLIKILSEDPHWKDLTALTFHYETQPLPNWISWNLHQLPEQFHKLSNQIVFAIELFIPFLIFGPRLLRNFAFVIFVCFQLLIMTTGSYGFFNLLTIALCFLLLDDELLGKRFALYSGNRNSSKQAPSWFKMQPKLSLQQVSVILIGTFLMIISCSHIAGLFFRMPSFMNNILAITSQFGINSSYGLFAVMTTRRPEIIIEGSSDGTHWKAYEFRWKPGNVTRAPGTAVPHQPRLDWQMWFAALGTNEQNPWLRNFMARLVQGSPSVIKLLELNPFPEKPPNYVRAVRYDYRFSDKNEKKQENGVWWTRKFRGLYSPVVSKYNISNN